MQVSPEMDEPCVHEYITGVTLTLYDAVCFRSHHRHERLVLAAEDYK